MKTLIDGYISPMTKSAYGQNADYTSLMLAILRVAMFYGEGIVASFVQGLLMARVTQGTLDDIRQRVFTHMENLPIRYFDTHAHGDIMSVYTNDIDTLRSDDFSEYSTICKFADYDCSCCGQHDSIEYYFDHSEFGNGWCDDVSNQKNSQACREDII